MGNVYTVAYVNEYIKNMFGADFFLNQISVRGEISNCTYHYTGHIYFSMKDKSGILGCMMYSTKKKSGLDFRLEEGQKVIVTGRIAVFTRDGNYKLYADRIEKEGIGDLYKRFLQMKTELSEMGMFAPEYKKKIPKYAGTVGIVTSKTGAAIQDIRDIAWRRNPYVRLVLYHAKVQGEGAAESIARGIETLDHYGVDVIIVGRGGGSIEDLWAFNEEIVARAIFGCQTPVISAVGHETDFTIADFVADLRAPTPSAAAELAVYQVEDLTDRLEEIRKMLDRMLLHKVEYNRSRVKACENMMKSLSPLAQLQNKKQKVLQTEILLNSLIDKKLSDRKHRLQLLTQRLDGLSPLTKLSGGYAYVSDENERPVTSLDEIEEGDFLRIVMRDGRITARVTGKERKAENR